MLSQPTTIQTVQPGATIFVRNAEPVAFAPPADTATWHMGTVSRVDRATNRIVLADGSALQVGSSMSLHRGDQKPTVEQLQPGSEIVARVSPNSERGSTAETAGTTAARSVATAAILPTSEIEVVWSPLASR